MAQPFKNNLNTPFLRDLNALCKKHGVTKLVCGYEDPDQATGRTTCFVQMPAGMEWSVNACTDLVDFIIGRSNPDGTWRKEDGT